MLAQLYEYLSERSGKSADKYIDDIYRTTKKLEKHPESCAPCRNRKLGKKGYRCCNVKQHIIIYEFKSNEVNVLAIIHSKRNPENIEV